MTDTPTPAAGPPRSQSFADLAGRTWTIPTITIAMRDRLKTATGFDIASIPEDPGAWLDRLSFDYEFLGRSLYTVLERPLSEAGVGPEQFAEALGGEVLYDAQQALIEATIDFFRVSRVAEKLRGVVTKALETADKVRAMRLQEAFEKIDAAVAAGRFAPQSEPSGARPESSDSTRDRTA